MQENRQTVLVFCKNFQLNGGLVLSMSTMLQHESRPHSGKHFALFMMGRRMAWERRTHVSLAKAFVNQLVLPGGVEQWVCHPILHLTLFRHLTWCMLVTRTPYRHRRACFFVRHQLGPLSKRMRRSTLNTQTSVALKCNIFLLDEGLRNLVCQLQRVTAYTQVEMEDAPTLLKIPKSECPDIWIRLPRHKWPKSWSSTEDPVVPLERNLYGHPSAGLLWERQIEKVLAGHGWEKVPNWECLFVNQARGLFSYQCMWTISNWLARNRTSVQHGKYS